MSQHSNSCVDVISIISKMFAHRFLNDLNQPSLFCSLLANGNNSSSYNNYFHYVCKTGEVKPDSRLKQVNIMTNAIPIRHIKRLVTASFTSRVRTSVTAFFVLFTLALTKHSWIRYKGKHREFWQTRRKGSGSRPGRVVWILDIPFCAVFLIEILRHIALLSKSPPPFT
jgi:hypothetical protein